MEGTFESAAPGRGVASAAASRPAAHVMLQLSTTAPSELPTHRSWHHDELKQHSLAYTCNLRPPPSQASPPANIERQS